MQLKAHTHARNASVETHKSNPIAASEEHDLAAGEFASAASGTLDAEVRPQSDSSSALVSQA